MSPSAEAWVIAGVLVGLAGVYVLARAMLRRRLRDPWNDGREQTTRRRARQRSKTHG